MTHLKLALCLVLGAAATGCSDHDIKFSDSIDTEFDLFALRRHDSLHSPYVLGAEFSVCADAEKPRGLAGMHLRSADPSVFRVEAEELSDKGDRLCASATALAAGLVEIQVIDDGDVVASRELDIRQPDHAELFAAGPVLADNPDLDPKTEVATLLEGGTATFLLRYFDQSTELHGQGALVVASTDALEAEAEGTVLFEDREWIRLTANELGQHEIELATPAGMFDTVRVEVVGEDAVADVAVHGSDERDREEGDSLMVYAQAYDEEDAPIYGVAYDWSLGGTAEPESGDLFKYQYDPDDREELVARFGALDAAVEIRAGEGFVDSSNNVGCSVGGRNGGTWALVLLLAAGLGRRRRR